MGQVINASSRFKGRIKNEAIEKLMYSGMTRAEFDALLLRIHLYTGRTHK